MPGRREDVRRIILTASGGPFRTWSLEAIRKVTVEQALKHPNWSMGPKVTIDSATLMNKGLELIEAHHLFALAPERARRRRPSAIGGPWPGGIPRRLGHRAARLAGHAHPDRPLPGLAGAHVDAGGAARSRPAATLTFEEPDPVRFPALALARKALAAGGAAPTILNAANEIAVREFVGRRLGFGGIPALVEATLDAAERRGEMAGAAIRRGGARH